MVISTCEPLMLAEKERFELSMEVSPHTRLAGERLQPLGHFSVIFFVAEEVGFEPTKL
jgi:hypothetical protein